MPTMKNYHSSGISASATSEPVASKEHEEDSYVDAARHRPRPRRCRGRELEALLAGVSAAATGQAMDHLALMARFNGWANDRLYASVARLPEAAYRAERGAFFGS